LGTSLREQTIDWRGVIWLASRHWVLPSFAAGLQWHGMAAAPPAVVADALAAARSLNRERNHILRQALTELTATLNRQGLEPLLLKGANALLADAYPGAEDRMIGDLDLYLPEAAHPAATAALMELRYREAEESWQMMLLTDRRSHHHGIPLLHTSRPVKVELHRRILKCPKDDAHLVRHMNTERVTLAPGITAQVPDSATRLRHNYLHAHIYDRQAVRRRLNLRQLLEFSRLAESLGPNDPQVLLAGLRSQRQRCFHEYWAQAEHWLQLPYPTNLPRSPRQQRELWLTEQAAQSRIWSNGFSVYNATLRLPRRLWGLGVRLVQAPGYFPVRYRMWRNHDR
jgi:hypothetical protein